MNGVINVYKEPGWTSGDAVNKLKGVLHERHIGHAGTLDPDAEGVLPVCVGKATRLFDFLTSCRKTYLARIRFGVTTDTQDGAGRVLEEKPVAFSESDLQNALETFTGVIRQTPPMYSALHFQGQRLYDLARRGETADVPAREVTIEKLELAAKENENTYLLRVVCSKGTYVRTLCHDVGRKLGCGAYMAHLTREKAGNLDIVSALRIREIEEKTRAGDTSFLIPTDRAVDFLPRVDLPEDCFERLSNGNPVALPGAPEAGFARLYCKGEFFGIGEAHGDVYKIKCLLRENHGNDSGSGHV